MVILAIANTTGRGKFTAFGVVTADLEEMVIFISTCTLSPMDLTDVVRKLFSSLKYFNATFNDKNHIHSLILQARDVRLITPSLSSLKTSPYCIMHTELLTSFVLDINGNGCALRFEVVDNVYNVQDAPVLY
uniref:Uncharacterized protein n=1 Tax=Glossina pallidipes TaxID=7398 RepID=A0A1B0A6D1_GLOPL